MSILVAITGASGSGKTTLAKKVHARLSKQYRVEIISMDDYYHCQDDLDMAAREKTNYDHPNAFDHSRLIDDLSAIKSGEHVERPNYDFTVHTRKPETTKIPPLDVCIVEGILPISEPKLRACYDLTLYLDVPIEVCLERRRTRDIKERGRTPESVEKQFKSTVIPGFEQFISPQKSVADICLTGKEPVATVAEQILKQL